MSDVSTSEPRSRVPAYVAARIRQPPPADCDVLAGSTPVVAFGDPRRARVATLGLNPSRAEFEEGGIELEGPRRRFETLRSLGVTTLEDAHDSVIDRVWERCNGYFHGNPYRWFDRLEEVLNAVGASYFDESACHLDLSQWATDPTWGGLTSEARQRLTAKDSAFLLTQLQAEPIDLLLLNGLGVLRAFRSALDGDLQPAGGVEDRSVRTMLHVGAIRGIQVVGWSTNLQSSFGVTKELRNKLALRISELAGADRRPRLAGPLGHPRVD